MYVRGYAQIMSGTRAHMSDDSKRCYKYYFFIFAKTQSVRPKHAPFFGFNFENTCTILLLKSLLEIIRSYYNVFNLYDKGGSVDFITKMCIFCLQFFNDNIKIPFETFSITEKPTAVC